MDGERRARAQSAPSLAFRGGRAVSAVPILFFILWAIVQSAVFRISDTRGLIVGTLLGLILGMPLVRGSWKPYADAVFEGMTQKVTVTAIVAWLWAGMFADTLQAGGFVGGLAWLADAAGVGGGLFPAVTFLLAALLATGIGTGYGTTIAFVALFYPAGLALGADPVLTFAAILSGAVFGDNLAPVSDTTIVSAVTQDADIGGVVASRFKYALFAAVLALACFLLFGAARAGEPLGAAEAVFGAQARRLGLAHFLSIGLVIFMAVRGRHIIEAISWGLFAAGGLNLLLGLAPLSRMIRFEVPASAPVAGLLESWSAALPQSGPAGAVVDRLALVELTEGSGAVGGSLYSGAIGFLPMSVLILLVVAAAHIMIRGGGFAALQDWMGRVLARTVRRAETTMVLGTALVNGMITINTAAEIAIAPSIADMGKRFNLNGYRRANILDANTSALGYIFPWAGGVLVGFSKMGPLAEEYAWFDPATMIVNPVDVWPFVFHGWFLVLVFLFAAWTGFGREYVTDRRARRETRV